MAYIRFAAQSLVFPEIAPLLLIGNMPTMSLIAIFHIDVELISMITVII